MEVIEVNFQIRKPDGTISSYPASIISHTVDSVVCEYLLQPKDVDIAGSYQVVALFLMSTGWQGSSERMGFIAETMFT